ncbi:hypothetical protein FB645_002624 [Coemansia sp. IMI 203386]|nr:hypothetical protein FB645_002624 [Coemansia sp. IMI 203386]
MTPVRHSLLTRVFATMPQTTATPRSPRSPRPAVVVAVDFDKTLTVQDTVAQVVAAASSHNHPQTPSFDSLVDAYTQDLATHQSIWAPKISNHVATSSVTVGFLQTYLDSHRTIEHASLARISASKLMAGVSRKDFSIAAAKNVCFQPGASTALRRFLHLRLSTYIVSVNWSEDFIRGALHANGVEDAEHIKIICNDPAFDCKTGLSTGELVPRITVAGDKVEAIREIRRSVQESNTHVPFIVYVGDSLTDLPALIDADLGFVIGNNSSVMSWCRWLDLLPQPELPPGSLRFTNSWPDIENAVVQKVLHNK